MNRAKSVRFFVVILICAAMVHTPSVWAQRTGDHIVPAIETICDDDPFSFGLCNAYCEALDCDSDTPLGTPRACSNLLFNYMKKSEGEVPPCEQTCPCDFEVQSDFADLVIEANNYFGDPDPANVIDLSTYDEFCDVVGETEESDGQEIFIAYATLPGTDPEGANLAYWVDEELASCHELGGGFDGSDDIYHDDYSYGPWLENEVGDLTQGELADCTSIFEKLCPPPEDP